MLKSRDLLGPSVVLALFPRIREFIGISLCTIGEGATERKESDEDLQKNLEDGVESDIEEPKEDDGLPKPGTVYLKYFDIFLNLILHLFPKCIFISFGSYFVSI